MRKLFLITAVLALLATQAGAATLIGGFNGGLGAWTDTGSGVFTVASLSWGGNELAPTEGSQFLNATMYGGVWLAPGMINAGDWMSFDYATDNDYSYWAVSKPGPPYSSVNGVMANTGYAWTHESIDLSSLAGISDAQIFFGDGEFVLDNVTLGAVPEPSSIIALLGGLGSLLAFRRRRK